MGEGQAEEDSEMCIQFWVSILKDKDHTIFLGVLEE
jgi:hypothetical protein